MYLCWSSKGGSGTTVVAAALALLVGARRPSLAVDLAGDLPAALGLESAPDRGVAEWCAAGVDVPDDGLARIERDVTDHTGLLPRGTGTLGPPHRIEALMDRLRADGRPVVLDGGVLDGGRGWVGPVVDACEHRIVVVRGCYLALRRLADSNIEPTGAVLVREPGRVLGRAEVETVCGVPVLADLAWDPAVARAVDAGLLASRLPRSLRRGLPSVLS